MVLPEMLAGIDLETQRTSYSSFCMYCGVFVREVNGVALEHIPAVGIMYDGWCEGCLTRELNQLGLKKEVE